MKFVVVMVVSESDGQAFNLIVCKHSKTSVLKGSEQRRFVDVLFLHPANKRHVLCKCFQVPNTLHSNVCSLWWPCVGVQVFTGHNVFTPNPATWITGKGLLMRLSVNRTLLCKFWKRGFAPRAVHVTLVLGKESLWPAPLLVLPGSHINYLPSLFCTVHFNSFNGSLDATLPRRSASAHSKQLERGLGFEP